MNEKSKKVEMNDVVGTDVENPWIKVRDEFVAKIEGNGKTDSVPSALGLTPLESTEDQKIAFSKRMSSLFTKSQKSNSYSEFYTNLAKNSTSLEEYTMGVHIFHQHRADSIGDPMKRLMSMLYSE
jgi:hypothetical protein